MANDYIPRGDAEFNGWQANFGMWGSRPRLPTNHSRGRLCHNEVALGLVAGDMTPITTAQTAWISGYTAHIAAQAAAQSARDAKDGNRAAYEALVRALVRRLQASPAVSDPEREALGITVPDTDPTPVGPPTTRPLARVDCSQRLQHTIDFTDESTPTRRAKPAGVIGASKMRVAWASRPRTGPPPPVDPGELTFLAVDTRTPYTRGYPGSDGGKPAHYMLRWINSRGETGPWSETVTATIGA